MHRKEFTRKVRAQAIARADGRCQRCSAALKPGEGEYDHILPCELGGEATLANCQVLCKTCHRGPDGKTRADVGRIRKADRQRDKNTPAIRPKGNIRSAGFPRKERAERPALPPRALFVERRET